jgi:hypothetical protein
MDFLLPISHRYAILWLTVHPGRFPGRRPFLRLNVAGGEASDNLLLMVAPEATNSYIYMSLVTKQTDPMKTLYLFLSLLFLPVCANGQSDKPYRPWKFGAMVGRPVAGKIYDDSKMRSASGLVLGLDFAYFFEKKDFGPSMHFQPNFNTFKKTETVGSRDNQYYVASRWKWEAIHLPVSFRYTFSTGIVKPFVEFGLNFRFRTALFFRNSGHVCGVVSCFSAGGGQSLQNVANKDKLGILAGAGVEVDAGKVTIPISIRLVESILQPKDSDDQGPTPTYSNLRTKLIQVTTGVVF